MIVMLNNKCHFTKDEFIKYQEELQKIDKYNNTLILCPSNIYLALFESTDISLASQNVSKFDNGAHTGEVSALQLSSLKVKYSLVGHSERREEEKENDEDIALKIEKLNNYGIKPVLCIGETLNIRKSGETNSFLLKQISSALKNNKINLENLIIAYEPRWAIGTGVIPTKEEIEEVVNFIKSNYPVKVLYGGSVNEKNVTSLNSSVIDGYLLGGISLEPKKLQQLLKSC